MAGAPGARADPAMNLRTATLQRLLVLAVIALAIAYLALLRPLSRRVLDEETPLRDLREQIARATLEAGLPRGTPFETLSNRLVALHRSAEDFSAAIRESLPRLNHSAEVKARLEEPFQLVEFLNESQRRVEELFALAQSSKVKLTPGLARGFPRYQAELARPELLWVQLATINRVLRTAMLAGVGDISEASVEPLPVVEPVEIGPTLPALPLLTAGTATNRWATLRVHLTASGDVDAFARLLLALTLSPAELERVTLTNRLAGHPALFVDHLMLRRNALEAAEQAQLELVVSTVVANEEP